MDSLRLILETMTCPVVAVDGHGRILFANTAAAKLFTTPAQGLRGRHPSEFFSDEAPIGAAADGDPVSRCLALGTSVHSRASIPDPRQPGQYLTVELTAVPTLAAHDPVQAVISLYDVTRTVRTLQQLAYEASHDPLTGLGNRNTFLRRLDALLGATDRRGEHALLQLVLNGFKQVNESCGHAAGDAMLHEASRRFLQTMGSRGTLSRLGGSEFGLILEHCDEALALECARRLREALRSTAFAWAGREFPIDASIGVVSFDASCADPNHLLATAERASHPATDGRQDAIHLARMTRSSRREEQDGSR